MRAGIGPVPESRLNSKLSLYDALLGASVPADRARAVVEALEHEMYTVLATKTDLAAQAQLLDERLERLRAEIREDLTRAVGDLRLELRAVDGALRNELHALRAEMQVGDAALRDELRAGDAAIREAMHAADASIREEMRAGFTELRVDLARLAQTLTLRLGAGLAALGGILVAAEQLL